MREFGFTPGVRPFEEWGRREIATDAAMTQPAPSRAVHPSVVVLDPDPGSGAELEKALRNAGCDVTLLRDAQQVLKRIGEGGIDVAVLDEAIVQAKTLLNDLHNLEDQPATIVVSNFGTVEGAVSAMRDGASHYAAKPVSTDEIVLAVQKASGERRLRTENKTLREEIERRTTLGSLVTRDPKLREIYTLAETVARTRATVLILGESGSGKSMLARAIHSMSPRKAGPFVEVNCGALPESLLESELFGHARGAFTGALRDRPGRFEAAHGGTIFLDEIGTAPPSLQVRLLRVLQDRVVERVGEERSRNVDVRVVLATNTKLEAAVKEGRFREDLYYRVKVVTIELPPLRERPVDIPELAARFVAKASRQLGREVRGISPEAMDELRAHPWPGNVRELENAIERAIAIGSSNELIASDLPTEVRRSRGRERGTAEVCLLGPRSHSLDDIPLGALEKMLAVCEMRFLERALAACQGNRTKAAVMLGLHRATLYQRMQRVGLDTHRNAQ